MSLLPKPTQYKVLYKKGLPRRNIIHSTYFPFMTINLRYRSLSRVSHLRIYELIVGVL